MIRRLILTILILILDVLTFGPVMRRLGLPSVLEWLEGEIW